MENFNCKTFVYLHRCHLYNKIKLTHNHSTLYNMIFLFFFHTVGDFYTLPRDYLRCVCIYHLAMNNHNWIIANMFDLWTRSYSNYYYWDGAMFRPINPHYSQARREQTIPSYRVLATYNPIDSILSVNLKLDW